MASSIVHVSTVILMHSTSRYCRRLGVFSRSLNTNIYGSSQSTPSTSDVWQRKMKGWIAQYEELIGLTEVKMTQGQVIMAEKKFVGAQEMRRNMQLQILDVQAKLKEIHAELDRVMRGEDKYLTLVTQEHAMLKEEKQLVREFHWHEKAERECFSVLSNAVRESHEKERSHAQKTKYWSVFGSVLGTIVGITGSSLNNRRKMKEVKNLVLESSGALPKLQDLKSAIESVEGSIKNLKEKKHHTENKLSELISLVNRKLSDTKHQAHGTVNSADNLPERALAVFFVVLVASLMFKYFGGS